MRYVNFLILIDVFICLNVYSQHLSAPENQQAHRRYWYYRTRFINDFVKIGGEQGDAICFPQRNNGNAGGVNSVKAKVGPDQIDITNQYLSALALEYKILSRNNQRTDETVKEIFYLLKAINRLDSRADEFWGGTTPATDDMSGYSESANLNGFMLREDMPHDYLSPAKNYKHYNYAVTEINNLPGNTNLGYAGLRKIDGLTDDNKFSNYQAFNPNFSQLKEDLSCPHDKYQSMFIAFMFLVKYIPANTGYYENGVLQPFQDGETGIIEEALKITNRCLPYLRGNRFGGPGSNWLLEYPDGTNLAAGQNALNYSYPFATMVCHINGGYPYSVPCNSYQDFTSLFAGAQSYGIFPYNPVTYTQGGEDAAVFINNCIAGSNSAVHPLGSIIGIPACDAIHYTATLNNMQWSELVRKVLHQKQPMRTSTDDYSGPIASAPCSGPYNFGGGNDAGADWKSPDRLEHPKFLVGFSPEGGNYPGVDYMFLHNLYYEYLNQQGDAEGYGLAINLMDNYDVQIWPREVHIGAISITVGVNTLSANFMPAFIKVFQNLESTAQIYATASPAAPNNTVPSKVEYRAGKVITLKPGFEVKAGADFYAYVKRYVCSDGDYGSGLRQAQTGDNLNNDYMSDEMNTIVPIHYVDGPKSASDLYPESSDYENIETNTVNSSEFFKGSELIIVPNPSSGLIKIKTQKISDDEILSVHVYDMKGQLILSYDNIPEEKEIDLQSYSKGIYMVQVLSNKGSSRTKKIDITD